MRKGHAELVSVLPTLPLAPSSLSTLGELQTENRKDSRLRFRPLYIHPRHLGTGSYLDYGPYASFAPSFDSEGAEVGQCGLGEILSRKLERKKVKDARRKLIAKLQADQDKEYKPFKKESSNAIEEEEEKGFMIQELLSSIFPDQRDSDFKDILRNLQIEEGISQLLEKNAYAMERLNFLQSSRLRDGFTPVKEDTEEWRLGRFFSHIFLDHAS